MMISGLLGFIKKKVRRYRQRRHPPQVAPIAILAKDENSSEIANVDGIAFSTDDVLYNYIDDTANNYIQFEEKEEADKKFELVESDQLYLYKPSRVDDD